MNGRKLIGAAVVLAAAAPAFAGEMTQDAELDTFVSEKTRVQVLTEIANAYAQGWKPGLIHGYTGSTSEASTKILDVAGEAIP